MKKLISNCSILFFVFKIINSSESQAQNNLRNYWQQEVNYTIQVKLDDVKNYLRATESINYINHSPDTLKYIWFHLWPNAYKNNNTAFAKQKIENGSVDFYFSKEEDRGFIDSLNFEINGERLKLEYDSANIDIAKVWLNKSLIPGEQVLITTPFRVKIPRTFSRLGHAGQQYQISQWYPKPAVYDRKGWHAMPYLDQGEFYSEFGVFDVFITLPQNYVIDATGSLENEEEELWLLRKNVAAKRKLSIELNYLEKEIENSYPNDTIGGMVFPVSASELKTLHYHAEDVHDFAWFADKRYLIVNDLVVLESEKKVVTTVLFTENHSATWKNAINYIDSAIYYYSKWIGDYPYSHATTVDGALVAGGGMEYPMITVIGGVGNSLDEVIAHEVGHNWFYGILGFNERDHPWMDEGINSFYEARYSDRKLKPGNSIAPKFLGLAGMTNLKLKHLTYLITARPHNDQPADIPSVQYTQLNYGAIVYSKVPVMLSHLSSAMGSENFDKTMHLLFDEWKFKHVYPEDMKKVFEQSSPMYFDWFFEQYLNTTDILDFKILNAKDTTHIVSSVYYKVKVKNNGGLKAPYSITAIKDNKPVLTKWYGGMMGKWDVLFPYGDYDEFVIDYKNETPEFRQKNNQLKMHGILRLMEKLKLQPVVSIENPKRTQLFFSPIAGWNNYDKGMVGLAVYNSFIPSRNFQYQLAPMYSFNTKQMTGIGRLQYFVYLKNSFVKNICFSTNVSSFHYLKYLPEIDLHTLRFERYAGKIDFKFRNKSSRTNISKTLSILFVHLKKEELNLISFIQDSTSTSYTYEIFRTNYSLPEIKFSFEKQQSINPYLFIINLKSFFGAGNRLEVFNNSGIFLKTEFNYRINYKKKGDGFGIRFYADYMLDISNVPGFNPQLAASNGSDDYAFDEVFLARSESTGFLSHQMMMNRGGMKFSNAQLISPIGGRGVSTIALNLTSTLLIPVPVFAFADFGCSNNSSLTTTFYKSFQYDGGIGIKIIPDICTVYLTLVSSPDIKLNAFSVPEYDKWYKRYFFTLNFSRIVPFDKIRDLKI